MVNARKNNIHLVLFSYWFILLVWQNVRTVGNRGGVDVFIKGGLIVFLFFYYFFSNKTVRGIPFISAIGYIVLTLDVLFSSGLSLSNVISYTFPAILFFLVYGLGSSFIIDKKQLITICNCLIICVSYIAIYAIIFCRDQFANAFSISSAYGNELASFLTSNFEYGLYLTFGVVAILLRYHLEKPKNKYVNILCLSALALFTVNLILTFSRTTIISFLVLILTYAVFFEKAAFKRPIVICGVIVVLLIIYVPFIREFVFDIVFKENTDSGRDELANIGITIFKQAPWHEKLFGVPNSSYVISQYTVHGNLHSGYIQTLVTNGIKGIIAVVLIIAYEMNSNIKIIKEYPKYKQLAIMFVSFDIVAALVMLVTTCMLFFSSIDSFFLTMFTIIIPKYVRNAIVAGVFDKEEIINE